MNKRSCLFMQVGIWLVCVLLNYVLFVFFRHLNASVMLLLGVPDKYAMERGGWSTDNILKSVYQQTFSSERERVDDLIDEYFNDAIAAENAGETANMQL